MTFLTPSPAFSTAPSPTASTSIAVVGLGYVGLPTALALHAAGVNVVGIDISAARLRDIATGDVDLLPSDHERLAEALGSERFTLHDDAGVLSDVDTVLVCVPTPVDRDLRPDLRALRGACATVVAAARPGQLIVLTSTSHVGATRELVAEPLAERGLDLGTDVFVAFSPERIDPGNAHHLQETTPRVVGGVTAACAARAAETIGALAPHAHVVSSLEAAEMAKLLENTFRAINIAFANEMASAAQHYGLDPVEIVDAAASKPFGFMPFYPSAGVGGHCIPCDPHYLLKPLQRAGADAPLTDLAMQLIARRPRDVAARALELLAGDGIAAEEATVLVVGAAYKPGVADVRESPAVEIMEHLHSAGVRVVYHDPLVPTLDLPGVPLVSVPAQTAADCDLAIVVTVHPEGELDALDACPRVLDATYRTERGARRELV